MIGIGAKDDVYYVDYYKKTFKVQFPLFPDEDRTIHKMVGEPPTPFFIAVKISDSGKEEIIYTHLGKIPPVDEFIAELQKRAGIK